jgi:phosphoglycerol geranylgeranyltransferase
MVGGSTGLTPERVGDTILAIKDATDRPVIIFPTSASTLSQHADAIFFMSMINSRFMDLVMGQQIIGAPIVKKMGLEPIPMGYIVVEPGMKVGEVGMADVIKEEEQDRAVGCALAAQYLGMKLVYLEAGSGAPHPVFPDIIHSVKAALDVPLIVGGGIRRPEQATTVMRNGADIVVTGTIVEEISDPEGILKKIIAAVKSS